MHFFKRKNIIHTYAFKTEVRGRAKIREIRDLSLSPPNQPEKSFQLRDSLGILGVGQQRKIQHFSGQKNLGLRLSSIFSNRKAINNIGL